MRCCGSSFGCRCVIDGAQWLKNRQFAKEA
jgi:hypothetical protein